MVLRAITVVAVGWLMVGCAARLPEVTPEHPASPAAEPAPPVSPSDTLRVEEPVEPPSGGEMGDTHKGMSHPGTSEGD